MVYLLVPFLITEICIIIVFLYKLNPISVHQILQILSPTLTTIFNLLVPIILNSFNLLFKMWGVYHFGIWDITLYDPENYTMKIYITEGHSVMSHINIDKSIIRKAIKFIRNIKLSSVTIDEYNQINIWFTNRKVLRGNNPNIFNEECMDAFNRIIKYDKNIRALRYESINVFCDLSNDNKIILKYTKSYTDSIEDQHIYSVGGKINPKVLEIQQYIQEKQNSFRNKLKKPYYDIIIKTY